MEEILLKTKECEIPEQQFLQIVLDKLDLVTDDNKKEIKLMLESRLEYKQNHDFASISKATPFYLVAMGRLIPILMTLCLEMIVGFVISYYHGLLQRQILITSFLPVLSAIQGNVGLQSSTNTLRGLSTVIYHYSFFYLFYIYFRYTLYLFI